MCPASSVSPLPAVHRVLALPEAGPLTERFGHTAVTESVRAVLAEARRQLTGGIKNVTDQWFAGNRVQHLGQVGNHALALSGSENDDIHAACFMR